MNTFKSFMMAAACCAAILAGCRGEREVRVELQTALWSFAATHAPADALTGDRSEGVVTVPADTFGFMVKFRADLRRVTAPETILEIPGVLEVTLSDHDPAVWRPQNYPAYSMEDGSVPVLEASLRLRLPTEQGEVRDMTVGIPLAMLERPEGDHEIVLLFSGVRWSMYVDGELVDNDFPWGYPEWGGQKEWRIDPSFVNSAELCCPAPAPVRITLEEPDAAHEIQYWTPKGHNAWVGDVVTFFHRGRYHVFYLYDRRGHKSKFGKGAHYFEHLSTDDLKNWVEHEAAVPIEHQWETFGTGTPFIFDGRLCLSYGLHTTRLYPVQQTTLPAMREYLAGHGATGALRYDTIPELYPAGSSYSVSRDGISDFGKTHILFHPCENPSIYTTSDGRLRMLANYGERGTWESANIDRGWHVVNPDFPPGRDCTFFFSLNGFDYIVGGFTGMWSKRSGEPDNCYRDMVAPGLDLYNGMCVPSVTEIGDGRLLMAGWVKVANWGGPLVIHELVQYPDGRLGTKWPVEVVPATVKSRVLARRVDETSLFDTPTGSFMLSFDVCPSPGGGAIGVSLLKGGEAGSGCELLIDSRTARAQYGTVGNGGRPSAKRSLREGCEPHENCDYAIENLVGTDTPFGVRMIVKHDRKLGGTLVDTEIAGQRTMISFRRGQSFDSVLFRPEDLTVRNIRVEPLKWSAD